MVVMRAYTFIKVLMEGTDIPSDGPGFLEPLILSKINYIIEVLLGGEMELK